MREPPASEPTAMTDDELWTMDQLARYLQTNRNTIYGWRYEGKGPRGFKLGRSLRFRRSDVEAWLREQAEAGS